MKEQTLIKNKFNEAGIGRISLKEKHTWKIYKIKIILKSEIIFKMLLLPSFVLALSVTCVLSLFFF